MKKLTVFDLDGTLAESKSSLDAETATLLSALLGIVKVGDFRIAETWGEQIEDRGSQITFSALGQQAPIEEKKKWDPDFTKREKIKSAPR